MTEETNSNETAALPHDFGLGFFAAPWPREQEAAQLWNRVAYAASDVGPSVVVLTGASGSGKSFLAGKPDSSSFVELARDEGFHVSVVVPVIATADADEEPETGSERPGKGPNASASQVSFEVREDPRPIASFRRILVVDQAERLIRTRRAAREGIPRLRERVQQELAAAKEVLEADGQAGQSAVVVCLLVLRDDDFQRATALASAFGLKAFPSSIVYRLGGLSDERQQALLEHFVGGAANREVMAPWETRIREVLPLHVKIAADAIRAGSTDGPEEREAWTISEKLLVRYPELLIRKRSIGGAPQVEDLLEVCYATARASWAAERISGGEATAVRSLSVEEIERYVDMDDRKRGDLSEVLQQLAGPSLGIMQNVAGRWEFAHDYLAGAFSELDRAETLKGKQRWVVRANKRLNYLLLAVAGLLAVLSIGLTFAVHAKHKLDEKRCVAEVDRARVDAVAAKTMSEAAIKAMNDSGKTCEQKLQSSRSAIKFNQTYVDSLLALNTLLEKRLESANVETDKLEKQLNYHASRLKACSRTSGVSSMSPASHEGSVAPTPTQGL
jgi:Novel STAND NTPase 1